MLKLLAYFRRPSAADAGLGPPYQVSCACGRVLRGVRQARRQFVPCPACGRKVFVLARSPLFALEGSAPMAAPPHGLLGGWRLPLFAGMGTLAVLIVLFFVLSPYLGRPAASRDDAGLADPRARLTVGRQALARGDFHRAALELRSALEQDGKRPQDLSTAERAELVQLQRQSDLLVRLLSRSLQEIVQEADLVLNDDEWQARFIHNYEGKSVVFDDAVRFDDAAGPAGRRRPVLVNYRVMVAGRPVRLALEDLDVLQGLPLERPQRLLFGGRLARVRREEGGRWVVGFAPDSGVLLTDRSAAEAVCPGPPDRELLDALKRQQEWLRR